MGQVASCLCMHLVLGEGDRFGLEAARLTPQLHHLTHRRYFITHLAANQLNSIHPPRKYTTVIMIDQGQFYKQLTRTLTPLAFRESVEKGKGSPDGDISAWVCDFLAL